MSHEMSCYLVKLRLGWLVERSSEARVRDIAPPPEMLAKSCGLLLGSKGGI